MFFLTGLYRRGLQYNSMNVARSALNSFLKICGNVDINLYEEITRFMKGVFNLTQHCHGMQKHGT